MSDMTRMSNLPALAAGVYTEPVATLDLDYGVHATIIAIRRQDGHSEMDRF